MLNHSSALIYLSIFAFILHYPLVSFRKKINMRMVSLYCRGHWNCLYNPINLYFYKFTSRHIMFGLILGNHRKIENINEINIYILPVGWIIGLIVLRCINITLVTWVVYNVWRTFNVSVWTISYWRKSHHIVVWWNYFAPFFHLVYNGSITWIIVVLLCSRTCCS